MNVLPVSIRRVSNLALLGAAFLAVGCGSAALTDFESKEHKFKVKMPGTPKVQNQNVGGLQQNIYLVEERNGAYMVFHQENPFSGAGLEKQMLEGAVTGLSSKGSVKSKTDIMLEGKYPGVDVHFGVTTPKAGEGRDRIYIVGNKLYQVMVIGSADFVNSDTSKKFMDSFQLIP